MGFLNKIVNVIAKPGDRSAKKADGKPESKPENRADTHGEFRQQEPAGNSGANAEYGLRAQRPAKAAKPKPAENHGSGWTSGEEKHLRDNYDKGVSIEALSEMHGRTREAIAHRLIKLGYSGITTAKRHEVR